MSVSTGIIPTEKIKHDLLNAREVGEIAMSEFIRDRLSDNSTKSFYDTLEKKQLSTFKNMNKVTSCKVKNKIIEVTSRTDIFSKIAIISQKRSIELLPVFAYPLGTVPSSLGQPDGTLNKTVKSSLLHKLEGSVEPLSTVKGRHAIIFDGMACVRQMKTAQMTWGQFAETLLMYVLSMGRQAERVDVVFDVYIENSIKDVERNRRAGGTSLVKLKKIISSAPIKQWTEFLASSDNKNLLVEFIVREWQVIRERIKDKVLYVTVGQKTLCLSETLCREIDELKSDHEEADTRIILHALHASPSYQNIVINSPDTDVFMIALSTDIDADLFFMTGKKNCRRIIDVKKVGDEAYRNLNGILIDKKTFLSAMLGNCGVNSVESFSGKGKVRPFKIMIRNEKFIKAFATLGSSSDVTDENRDVFEEFVCELYGWKHAGEKADVNKLRYMMYCRKSGKMNYENLPPCRNVLYHHIDRANYQVGIWRRSNDQYMNLDCPTSSNGWMWRNSMLDVKWMSCNPAPDEILEMILCDCKECSEECPCAMLGFVCTDACTCKSCNNDVEYPEQCEDSDDSEDDDVDDLDDDFNC